MVLFALRVGAVSGFGGRAAVRFDTAAAGSAADDDEQHDREERNAHADHPRVAKKEPADASKHSAGDEHGQRAADRHEEHGTGSQE
ncbi:hypothetical protein M3B43_06805 [Nesterenkonia massiliensis]|uniref:Uncharacterized protein n=1 Tax=Nesterenkonia massiliensis TaxID=1232429 RepID=A0ABT2HR84_9MICC|nr:hypothetical protein [Nesterenkonia massiliensis]MCT1607040.1 hypothetical protein [Nesterenkonia massiliensis]